MEIQGVVLSCEPGPDGETSTQETNGRTERVLSNSQRSQEESWGRVCKRGDFSTLANFLRSVYLTYRIGGVTGQEGIHTLCLVDSSKLGKMEGGTWEHLRSEQEAKLEERHKHKARYKNRVKSFSPQSSRTWQQYCSFAGSSFAQVL